MKLQSFKWPSSTRQRVLLCGAAATLLIVLPIISYPILYLTFIRQRLVANAGAIPYENGAGANIAKAEEVAEWEKRPFELRPVLDSLSSIDGLQAINMRSTRFKDSDLAVLGKFRDLTHLNISYTNLNAEGLQYISTAKNLHYLDLNGCLLISDSSFAVLGHLSSLEYLSLWGVPISDVSIPIIASLPKLKKLNIHGSHVSPTGVQLLREQRPLIEIVY